MNEKKAYPGQRQKQKAQQQANQGDPALPLAAAHRPSVLGVGLDASGQDFGPALRFKPGHPFQPPGPAAIYISPDFAGANDRVRRAVFVMSGGFVHFLVLSRFCAAWFVGYKLRLAVQFYAPPKLHFPAPDSIGN